MGNCTSSAISENRPNDQQFGDESKTLKDSKDGKDAKVERSHGRMVRHGNGKAWKLDHADAGLVIRGRCRRGERIGVDCRRIWAYWGEIDIELQNRFLYRRQMLSQANSPSVNVDSLPNEVLQRIFTNLNLESKLSAGLACRRWLNILEPAFAHMTDVLLVFEDDYCCGVRVQRGSNIGETVTNKNKRQKSMVKIGQDCGRGMLTMNLCACPQHLANHIWTFEQILIALGRYIKKLVVRDHLLQKGCFVDVEVLASFVKKCPELQALELRNLDLNRVSEKELLQMPRLDQLTELFFNHCSWITWTEADMNRAMKSILSCATRLQEFYVTDCPLLNGPTMLFWPGMDCISGSSIADADRPLPMACHFLSKTWHNVSRISTPSTVEWTVSNFCMKCTSKIKMVEAAGSFFIVRPVDRFINGVYAISLWKPAAELTH